MQVKRIQIKKFRKFNQGIELDNLEPTINVFYGPNESGKSTIVQAIRAAFLERHNTGTVTDFQPWGDSSAAPEVKIDFDHANKNYILLKRFLHQSLCSLNIDGQLLDGNEAEQHLAELLGYSVPGRGSSKPVHWGVPGLLWVEQGKAHEITTNLEHANELLQAILNTSIGEVVSSDGDKVLKVVEQRLSQLVTPATSAPRGEYKKALEKQSQLNENILHLNEQIASYQNQIDRLTALQLTHKQVNLNQPWVTLRQQASEARQKLTNAQLLQSQKEQAEKDLSTCKTTQQLLHNELRTLDAYQQTVALRKHAQAKAQEQYNGLLTRTKPLEQQQEKAQERYEQARKQLQAVSRLQQLKDQWAAIELGGEELLRLKNNLKEARSILKKLESARKQLNQLFVDPKVLKSLEKKHEELKFLEVRQQALATRLNVNLNPGQSLLLNNAKHEASFEQLITQETILDIENIGQIKITPGGEDIASLTRKYKSLAGELSQGLQSFELYSLQQLQQRSQQHNDLHTAIKQHESMLSLHAPNGVEALDLYFKQLEAQNNEARLNYSEAQNKYLTDYAENLSPGLRQKTHTSNNLQELSLLVFEELKGFDIVSAEYSEQKVNSELDECESLLRKHNVELATAKADLSAARKEYDQAHTEANNPNIAKRKEQSLQQLDSELAKQNRLEQSIKKLKDAINQVQPETLKQDIQRFESSAKRQQEEHSERERNMRELHVRLQVLGAQGLGESLVQAEADLAAIKRRVTDYERNTKALALLNNLLLNKKQELAQRLHAPLTDKIQNYLKLLFNTPDSIPTHIGEHLAPESLTRSGVKSPIEQLSFGTREQISTISRLAYADLLKDAGKPTLIMLDDALVHTDAARLEQLKRILFAAAQRHQIFLFTCHPEKWNDMGAGVYSIQDLIVY